ncbi:MAG: hypothetical protein K1X92_00565 [Bacteroidia bacterium]|nr:hypothetical protein [Bacteroidia bacterium]
MRKYLLALLLGFSILAMYGQTPFFLQKGTENHVLYRMFSNDIWLYTSNICEDLPFEVKVSDATFWQNPVEKRHLQIIPRGPKVKIEMHYYNTTGKEIYLEKTLMVIDPPGEYYQFAVDGKWINRHDIPIDKNSKITFRIVQDPEFKTLMGLQADYRVDSIWITVLPPDNHPPVHIKGIGFDIHQPQGILSIPLPLKCFAYGSGTKIFAEVGNVYRRNEKGEWVDFFVRASMYDRTGIFVVK